MNMRAMIAADIMLPPEEKWADWVLDRCCEDPEVWLTHGCPNAGKQSRIRDYIIQAIIGSNREDVGIQRYYKNNGEDLFVIDCENNVLGHYRLPST